MGRGHPEEVLKRNSYETQSLSNPAKDETLPFNNFESQQLPWHTLYFLFMLNRIFGIIDLNNLSNSSILIFYYLLTYSPVSIKGRKTQYPTPYLPCKQLRHTPFLSIECHSNFPQQNCELSSFKIFLKEQGSKTIKFCL